MKRPNFVELCLVLVLLGILFAVIKVMMDGPSGDTGVIWL